MPAAVALGLVVMIMMDEYDGVLSVYMGGRFGFMLKLPSVQAKFLCKVLPSGSPVSSLTRG